MRCLFTMFAEDSGLLDKGSFADVLADARSNPESFAPMLEEIVACDGHRRLFNDAALGSAQIRRWPVRRTHRHPAAEGRNRRALRSRKACMDRCRTGDLWHLARTGARQGDRKSTRLNSSH